MKKVCLYCRVSTTHQTSENQLRELRAVAERMGYEIVSEFIDNGISGAKSRKDRPALDDIMKLATQRKFEVVMCWSIDRLGRSLQHLVEILNELQAMKIDLFFMQQGVEDKAINIVSSWYGKPKQLEAMSKEQKIQLIWEMQLE